MSQTWFKTLPPVWGTKRIETVQVEKFTELSVTIKGRTQRRQTGFECFYPTWDEAYASIVADAEKTVERAKMSLQHAYSALDVARKHSKPGANAPDTSGEQT